MTTRRMLLIMAFVPLVLSSVSMHVRSAERQQVCAKYETEDGWSKSYQVNAVVASGSELNDATQSINYVSFEKYVVIFWREHQASVIKLDYPWLTIDNDGTDQEGRKWEVSPAYGVCF
ncbi:hypothetical protein [Burkholderia seminalis]|uniref:hypothetical protein n=1 Tax=Burkholderia seminalis TaxID=488731 RepID=UPI0019031BFC|nr:hypothetical protein [Burkholderia seminalis]MBJ9593684.1 hypothetical protein [Burkholderia seminalis]